MIGRASCLAVTRPACLIVDTGFSFTHTVPFYEQSLSAGIRRLNVGGKVLTNHLKDMLSYRQLDLSEETYVVDRLKHDVSFVSQDYMKDLRLAQLKPLKNPHMQDYLLPDFSSVAEGLIKPHEEMIARSAKRRKTDDSDEQIVRIANERFSAPELLFQPSDIGMSLGTAES